MIINAIFPCKTSLSKANRKTNRTNRVQIEPITKNTEHLKNGFEYFVDLWSRFVLFEIA